jgi:hypothetical protein
MKKRINLSGMNFEIISNIEEVETIAVGGRIRGIIGYDAHGIGKKEMKIKLLQINR